MMSKLIGRKLEAAKVMRDNGSSFTGIAKCFGTTFHFVKCSLDPEYLVNRAKGTAIARRKKSGVVRSSSNNVVTNKHTRADAEKLIIQIPKDTRTFTQAFCGDPLPGRSALDKRGDKREDRR